MVLAVLILKVVIFAYRPRLLTLVWICLLLLEIKARLSAKSRSSRKLLNFHLLPVFPCFVVVLITQSTTSRKRNPDVQQPCLTPVLISNQSCAQLTHQLQCTHSHSTSLIHHLHNLLSNAVAPHNPPECRTIYKIKCFLEVNKAYIKVGIPFNTLQGFKCPYISYVSYIFKFSLESLGMPYNPPIISLKITKK